MVGNTLGAYQILGKLGEGGMGEVYRARDSRLDRTVAIKVLPPHLSTSPEARERFEREARTVSQLSHPHICAIYDVGREGDVAYLVMEYVEGEVLADRLGKGPLPLEQALRVGAQLADALDSAHRHGIVHRDLKPGNIILTRAGAKLLDFGLAKLAPALIRPTEPGSDRMAVATQAHLTGEGTILGTVQYMAPEQLEGREADPRTDIFALGAVLYEMVTGRKPFAAASQASLISAIMTGEPPPPSSLAAAAPPLLDRLTKACLEKNPDDRVQTAHDVLLQLRWVAEGSHSGVSVPATTSTRGPLDALRRAWAPWSIAIAATAAAAWLAVMRTATPVHAPGRSVRSTILLPERLSLNNAVISPSGDRIVFSGLVRTGRPQLWVRPLDTEVAMPLGGTEGGVLPFWSPNGRDIGFFADRTLKRVSAAGGTPLSLYNIDGVGGAWSPGGDILFSAPSGPIYRVSANGGQATAVTALDGSRGETAHRYPSMLPDGRRFLFLAMKPAGSPRDPAYRICVGSLDGGAVTPIIPASFNPQYADGYLLFIRGGDWGGSLLAQPFDPTRLHTTGAPVTVSGYVAMYPEFAGLGSYSVSNTGVLLYDASGLLTRLHWFDRGGRPAGTFGDPAPRTAPRLSPDGSRVVYNVYDPGTQTTQVWIGDLERGVESRLTSPPASNSTPIWSPDGRRVAYQSDAKHQADIHVRLADGSGGHEAITDEEGQFVPRAWSADGRTLIAFDREPAGERLVGLTAIPLAVGGTRLKIVPRVASNIVGVSLSPDERWIAYDTDETGRREVHVVSYPEGTGKIQISNAGGFDPKWTRNGRELLYIAPAGQVMAVAVETGGAFRAGTPAPLFAVPEGALEHLEVSRDGQRFLFTVPVIKSSSVPLTLVQHWTAGLQR
jgi:eukaryotic-like serine/threonine-protein kinase